MWFILTNIGFRVFDHKGTYEWALGACNSYGPEVTVIDHGEVLDVIVLTGTDTAHLN